MADHLRLGLRFRKSAVRTLRNLAHRIDSERLPADASLFDKAADATEQGEPLVVLCKDRDEIEAMAHGFTLWGIARPVIEELGG